MLLGAFWSSIRRIQLFNCKHTSSLVRKMAATVLQVQNKEVEIMFLQHEEQMFLANQSEF